MLIISTPIQVSPPVSDDRFANNIEQSRGALLVIQIPANSSAQSMGDLQADHRQPYQKWSYEGCDEAFTCCAQVGHAQANKGCYHQYVHTQIIKSRAN